MRTELERALATMGLALPSAACERLLAYAALLGKWNRVYNLTAIRDPREMLTHHLLDSLAVAPHLAGLQRLADVGSGGGLPGIALAIACPEIEVVSIETVNKKASFQQQAKIELGLTNFHIENCRVEDYVADPACDAVISRAFASVADFVALTRHLLQPGGRWLAMKGVVPDDELAALPDDVRMVRSVTLEVPGLHAERHLIILEHS